MTGVELRAVHKAFGATRAVDGLDLLLPAGAVTVLLGPSGCGKTTTLRLVAGFERPDAGTVVIGDRTVAGPDTFVPPEQRRVGVVFQHLALFPHLDVAGNIAYGLRRAGRRERAARVAELLELVGLPGTQRRMAHELSGGQAQRIAIARALAPRPDVLLLDEPFSSLDVALRAGLRAELRRILRAAQVTTLLVTHDQGEALSLGDRVAVVLRGRVAGVGTPEELYRRPGDREVAAFLGESSEVRGEVRAGCLDSPLGPLAVALPDGPAVALVRAEDLDLLEDPAGGALVEDVDYFGHDQLVAVRLADGQRVRARLHARRQLRPGTTVRPLVRAEGTVTAFAAG